jgi:hypothetical protein
MNYSFDLRSNGAVPLAKKTASLPLMRTPGYLDKLGTARSVIKELNGGSAFLINNNHVVSLKAIIPKPK